MPLYDFRCPIGHVMTELCSYAESVRPHHCHCGEPTERLFPKTHSPPSGVYSYEPNIGSAEAFERKQEAVKNNRGLRGWDERVNRSDEA